MIYNDYDYLYTDTLTFDYMYMRFLNKKKLFPSSADFDYDCHWYYIGSPWHVYSTNKHPEYKQQKVVRFLCDEFCKEFGAMFCVIDIHGGGAFEVHINILNTFSADVEWKPFKDLTITKPYIKFNNDGWVIVLDALKFERDLFKFWKRMRKVFAENHYDWFYLDRLEMFFIVPDRLRIA